MVERDVREVGEIVRWLLAATLASASLLVAAGSVAQTSGTEGPEAGEITVDESQEDEPLEGEALRKRVTFLLSGYHFMPGREEFDGLASEKKVRSTLRAIAADRSTRPSLRSRAVDALALYPGNRTSSFLQELLEPPSEDLSAQERRAADLLRHHAITSLAKLHDDEEAVSLLEGLLEADERPIRLTTISALGKHAGTSGVRRLRQLAAEAEDELVRDELDRFVDVQRLQAK